jgi:hypothetical protein
LRALALSRACASRAPLQSGAAAHRKPHIGARRSANADDVAFAALVRALRRRADAASSQCALMPARPRRRRAGLGGAPEIADGGADGHSEAAGSAGWGSDGGESDDSEFERVELKPG